MENEIPLNALSRYVAIGAELGAIAVMVKLGHLRPYLKKSEAFRQFGRKQVEQWIELGLLTPRKDGDYSAAWRIDRLEIESLARAKDLLRYL